MHRSLIRILWYPRIDYLLAMKIVHGCDTACYMPPPLRLGVADDLAPAPIPALLGVLAAARLAIRGVLAIASSLILSALSRSILGSVFS
jgi:hypothetical protein